MRGQNDARKTKSGKILAGKKMRPYIHSSYQCNQISLFQQVSVDQKANNHTLPSYPEDAYSIIHASLHDLLVEPQNWSLYLAI